jgi:hypothetical protein
MAEANQAETGSPLERVQLIRTMGLIEAGTG